MHGHTNIKNTYKWNSFITFRRNRAKRNSTDEQNYSGNLYLVCLKFCTCCLRDAKRNSLFFPIRGATKGNQLN